MKKLIAMAAACASLSAPVHAQGLLKKLQDGASKAGDAVTSGAEAVGNTLNQGAEAVGRTVDSTVELFSDEDTPAQTRAKLDRMASEVLNRLLAENPAAAAAFPGASGYAVFDSRSITIFPVKAGYGRGVAINIEAGDRTYMNMGTGGVGIGAGIGGFASQFVIFFETQLDYSEFILNGYDATAEGVGKAGDQGGQETARFVDGRTFFVLDKKGWRVNASATGTKYWLATDLN